MVTLVPGPTRVPAFGLCFTTVPAGLVELGSVLTTGVSPSLVSVLCAALDVLPTSGGTLTCFGPVDTYRVMTVLAGSRFPKVGSVLITLPADTVLLTRLTTLGRRWAAVMSDSAFAWVR